VREIPRSVRSGQRVLTLPEAVSLARRLLAGASVGPEDPTGRRRPPAPSATASDPP